VLALAVGQVQRLLQADARRDRLVHPLQRPHQVLRDIVIGVLLEQGKGEPQPLFYSLRYGDPGYCKLFSVTDNAIRRGADDGGEMGAFHFVLAPMRETDLRVRMTEYLPVGLEFGVFYEN